MEKKQKYVVKHISCCHQPATLPKYTLQRAFPCKYFESIKNNFFTEDLWMAASNLFNTSKHLSINIFYAVTLECLFISRTGSEDVENESVIPPQVQ